MGCVPTRWDAGALEARHPALAALDGHRLGDATPYVWPSRGELVYFLCRWPNGARIPVSLPPDATEAERDVLEAALRAWEGAGLGVRFERLAPGAPAAVEIRFLPDVAPGAKAPRAAEAAVDCALDADALDAAGAVLPARVVSASIQLRRGDRDMVGRFVAVTPEQLAGATLHELGHALGFQGHARAGESAMVRTLADVKRLGRRALADEAFRDDALSALYAVPSGSVVRRLRVGDGHTESADRLAALATERGFTGPFAQVGDRVARVHWRDGEGRAYTVFVFGAADVDREPAKLRLRPARRAAALLAEAG